MENTEQTQPAPESNVTKTELPELYSLKGIAIATVVGSVFAGGYFMSINYKRLGKQAEASKALVYSLIASVAILALIMMIPEDINIPNMVFLIPQILGMYKIAELYQKEDLENHIAAGGEYVSNWVAFGFSLLIGVGLFALMFAITVLLSFY